MFNLSKRLKEKAKEVASAMEAENVASKELVLRTFSGFLVKDGTEEIQQRIDSKDPEILGSIISDTGSKYWVTLK